jgi:hypothetical protein
VDQHLQDKHILDVDSSVIHNGHDEDRQDVNVKDSLNFRDSLAVGTKQGADKKWGYDAAELETRLRAAHTTGQSRSSYGLEMVRLATRKKFGFEKLFIANCRWC